MTSQDPDTLSPRSNHRLNENTQSHHTSSSVSSHESSLAASVDEVSPAASDDGPQLLLRPKLLNRKSSGTMIVPSDAATTLPESEYDETDVRTMSPRRNSAELDRLGEAARRDLIEQAKVLQTSLQAIVDRVETVKTEHERLEGGNKFLQSYIGELMQTSQITSAAPLKTKSKGRGTK